MSSFTRSPRLVKGGLVLIDPSSSAIQRVISLQYNPDSLSRTLQIRATGESGERSEALRLFGPAVESFKLDAEIDATDQLEFPAQNVAAVESGIFSVLAALETIIYPTSAALRSNNAQASSGTLEIAPMEAPLTIFVWSRNRVVPVRLTDFSVTEEAFDANLNPIRAKVSIGMRVLSVDDLGFSHPGGSLFMTYLQSKESFAGRAPRAELSALGIERLS
jgi:hypothetical protein